MGVKHLLKLGFVAYLCACAFIVMRSTCLLVANLCMPNNEEVRNLSAQLAEDHLIIMHIQTM